MEAKENQTMDQTLRDVRRMIIAKIGEAYDTFVADVESNWDDYFKTHGKLLVSRKDILSLHSLNASARTRTKQKVEDAVQKYTALYAEALFKKIDEIMDQVLVSELARQFGKSKADIEVIWSRALLEMHMHGGIVDWFDPPKSWVAALSEAAFATVVPVSVLVDPCPPWPLWTLLLSEIPFTQLIINPAGFFLLLKRKFVDHLLREKESFLDRCKKVLDEGLRLFCEQMAAK